MDVDKINQELLLTKLREKIFRFRVKCHLQLVVNLSKESYDLFLAKNSVSSQILELLKKKKTTMEQLKDFIKKKEENNEKMKSKTKIEDIKFIKRSI